MTTRRLLLRSLPAGAAAMAITGSGAVQAQAALSPPTLTILHTNDVYEISPRRGKGGLAELMTLLRQERARSPVSITTFGGDLLSPSVLSSLAKGEQMIEIYNQLGTDIAVPGNHEYDYGPEVAAERYGQSRFPWLGANVLGQDGLPAGGLTGIRLVEAGGFKIGFLGVLTPDTAHLSSPGGTITFADPMRTAETAARQLKDQGADLVVALTHLEFAQDRALAAGVAAIDIVLGGHDHEPMMILEGGKLVMKAGSDAHWLLALDLAIQRVKQGDKEVIAWTPSWRMLTATGVAPDPEVKVTVDKWNRRLDAELGVVIGRTAVPLDSQRDTVRVREAAIGNLFADAMRNATASDIALTNGGGIRGDRTYPAGVDLSRKDILTELPFGNVTVVTELKGAEVLSALENGVSQVEAKAGRFPQVSGLSFTWDASKPPGSRVTEAKVGAAPLEPGRTYRLATNDFMLLGGDGYATLGRGKVVIDPSGATLMASTVINYVTALGGTVAPAVEGRITRLN